MSEYTWPVTMLEEYKVPADILLFFQGFVEGCNDKSKELEELNSKHNLLNDTSAKQERYIAELEKQIGILQKTLDLVDKNKPRFFMKSSSADIADMLKREPVILHSETDSITPIYLDRWFPASEPPKKMKTVICLYENEYGTQVGGGYVNDHGIWTLIAPAKGTITHWMHKPKLPQE